MANFSFSGFRRNLLLKMRPILRWTLKLRSSPEAIAGGLGVGFFIALTPTMGIQIFLSVFVATLLNLNRPAAVVPVWITNPFTFAPVYTFNYWIGLHFCSGPPVATVSKRFIDIGTSLAKMEFWDIHDQLLIVFQTGKEVLLPLIVGSVVVGAVGGILTYVLTLKFLRMFFSRRAKKKMAQENSAEKRESALP
ncbi:MAG: DUF2062 domain-containing protein [Desulfobulbus sp.]|jgi:uncharacterized protein (DUF2062 family)